MLNLQPALEHPPILTIDYSEDNPLKAMQVWSFHLLSSPRSTYRTSSASRSCISCPVLDVSGAANPADMGIPSCTQRIYDDDSLRFSYDAAMCCLNAL